jgi:hypothetical protein
VKEGVSGKHLLENAETNIFKKHSELFKKKQYVTQKHWHWKQRDVQHTA